MSVSPDSTGFDGPLFDGLKDLLKENPRGVAAVIVTLDANGDIVDGSALLGAGERNIDSTTNSYLVTHTDVEYAEWTHSDGDTQITTSPAYLYGIYVTSALTGDITLRDGTADTDTDVSGAVSATFTYAGGRGLRCETGIFLDDNASAGTLLVLWRAI